MLALDVMADRHELTDAWKVAQVSLNLAVQLSYLVNTLSTMGAGLLRRRVLASLLAV